LITGIGGFVGRHLVRHLLDEGDEVCGLSLSSDLDSLPPGVRAFQADICDRNAVDAVVRETRPDAVYHLAAQSSPRESLDDPWATLSNNLLGQLNLLDCLVASGGSARALVIGSSDEYGEVLPHEVPTSENVPLRPMTPYAVSKIGQDMLGYQYFAQYKLPVVRVRPFNHTGPGHDARFVIPSLALQLARIEAAERDPVLRVGNLDVARDFTDARDMVRAYRLAVLLGTPGDVYNLGRGQPVHIRDIVDDLLAQCRVSVRVVVDPNLVRRTDVPRQVADTSKFTALTGWQPRIPWETTLRDTLDYWRERVRTRQLSAVSGQTGSESERS
jgi:GDP-4-dehydro-6-deoxy-D-mannose reductase